jgi:hypothetical protein
LFPPNFQTLDLRAWLARLFFFALASRLPPQSPPAAAAPHHKPATPIQSLLRRHRRPKLQLLPPCPLISSPWPRRPSSSCCCLRPSASSPRSPSWRAPAARASCSRAATCSSRAGPAASGSLWPRPPRARARGSPSSPATPRGSTTRALPSTPQRGRTSASSRRTCGTRAPSSALQEAGPVDVLVCNQGVFVAQEIEKQDMEEVKWMVDINLMGTFHLVKAALPAKKERTRETGLPGSIAIMSSQAGQVRTHRYTSLLYAPCR